MNELLEFGKGTFLLVKMTFLFCFDLKIEETDWRISSWMDSRRVGE